MPHFDNSSDPNTFSNLPPFPDNIPIAPLLRISLEKLIAHDSVEEDRCWKACCDLGFFYLDLRTSSDDAHAIDGLALQRNADQLFDVMKHFYDLDIQVKAQYDFKEQGSYFGYKGYGEGYVDKLGTRDRNEFYNISKDDVLGLTEPLPSPAILGPHRNLYKSYAESCHAISMLITSCLSTRLPLTPEARTQGGLQALHRLHATSGDQIRFVKAPPQTQSTKGVALGEHSDFGSVTVLFNRLGGLQVLLPDSITPTSPSSSTSRMSPSERDLCQNGWTYVRPIPHHCIVNLGDALVKFSSGTLRSNIHRVVAPPGEQANVTRYSLVYFCRPEDDVLLRSLVGGEDEEAVTAKEWILRRALGRREVDGWEKSGGTEGLL
ncbi:oxidoreductase [Phaeosphaeriaceae sp. PMI808]|nr:oxidoreductase [Phaeosphaeriaceae sp. PMI808]